MPLKAGKDDYKISQEARKITREKHKLGLSRSNGRPEKEPILKCNSLASTPMKMLTNREFLRLQFLLSRHLPEDKEITLWQDSEKCLIELIGRDLAYEIVTTKPNNDKIFELSKNLVPDTVAQVMERKNKVKGDNDVQAQNS
jgi:hypothetical protein